MGRLLSLVIVMFSPRNCVSHRLPRVCCVPLSDLVSAVWDDAGTLGRAAVEVSEVGATVVSLTDEVAGDGVGVGDGVGNGVISLSSSSEFRKHASTTMGFTRGCADADGLC